MATSPIDAIWTGDKLKRKAEARHLERFLNNETDTLKRLGRNQAFVLGLDAQYGEGKSWFLARFRQQLALNHPVAFVDAWVDDANNEPLVSIMAALEDALQPFLTSKSVREKLGNLTRAALPIMGKAVLGAGGKLLGKYVGEEFGGDAADAISAASKAKSDAKGDDALQAGVDKLIDDVSEVVDNAGKVMLDQYRARQKSRETFKDNLRQLAASIEASTKDPRHAPIFVIVDELDRCRPSYAISLLEEIKHLFDVPGVVFIIALHGQQLTKSIEAVYGAQFDATSYLRRFFSRHYELRRLSIKELVISHFDDIPPSSVRLVSAPIFRGNSFVQLSPAELAGDLLTEWHATPREAQSVVDALRLFMTNWDYPNAIELPYVLILILNMVRGDPIIPEIKTRGNTEVIFALQAGFNNDLQKINSTNLMAGYRDGSGTHIAQLIRNNYQDGFMLYVSEMMHAEIRERHQGRIPGDTIKSSWGEYPDRVKELDRFVE